MKNPRLLFAGGLALLALFAGVVLLPRMDGDSQDSGAVPRVQRATLTLERFERPDTGTRELLVSLPDAELNRSELTGGEPRVALSCFDGGDEILLRSLTDWPLPEEEGFAPHIHQPADEGLLDRVRRCRLTGPGILFEGVIAPATGERG